MPYCTVLRDKRKKCVRYCAISKTLSNRWVLGRQHKRGGWAQAYRPENGHFRQFDTIPTKSIRLISSVPCLLSLSSLLFVLIIFLIHTTFVAAILHTEKKPDQKSNMLSTRISRAVCSSATKVIFGEYLLEFEIILPTRFFTRSW